MDQHLTQVRIFRFTPGKLTPGGWYPDRMDPFHHMEKNKANPQREAGKRNNGASEEAHFNLYFYHVVWLYLLFLSSMRYSQ